MGKCPEGMMQTSQGCVDSITTPKCPPGMIATSQGCTFQAGGGFSNNHRRGGRTRPAPRGRAMARGGRTSDACDPATGGFKSGWDCSGPGSDMVNCNYYNQVDQCSFAMFGVESCEQAHVWGYCNFTWRLEMVGDNACAKNSMLPGCPGMEKFGGQSPPVSRRGGRTRSSTKR